MFSIPRRLKDTSSLSKSTSVLPSNTSGEVKLREKKEMKKAPSQSDLADAGRQKLNLIDPKGKVIGYAHCRCMWMNCLWAWHTCLVQLLKFQTMCSSN